MASLWTLLFQRPRHRFARLDAMAIARPSSNAASTMGDGWVEIEEIRLNWLHRPARRARVCAQAAVGTNASSRPDKRCNKNHETRHFCPRHRYNLPRL
jgi:hypothetical protein